MVLSGTNPANAVNFVNCVGGSSFNSNNYGINIDANITQVSGSVTFTNISGGSGGVANYGIYVNPGIVVNVPSFIAT